VLHRERRVSRAASLAARTLAKGSPQA
jgi:hypothetical protein